MAVIGFTAQLEAGTGASDALEVVSESTMIQVPALQASTVESTHLAVTDGIRTYIPGLIDPGTVSFEANYTAGVYSKLKAILAKKKPWKISSPEDENQTFSFDGILTKVDLSFETEAVAKIKGEVKVTGDVTLGSIS